MHLDTRFYSNFKILCKSTFITIYGRILNITEQYCYCDRCHSSYLATKDAKWHPALHPVYVFSICVTCFMQKQIKSVLNVFSARNVSFWTTENSSVFLFLMDFLKCSYTVQTFSLQNNGCQNDDISPQEDLLV